jgi:hypothetical protein
MVSLLNHFLSSLKCNICQYGNDYSYWRVVTHLHSVSQIIAGGFLGTLGGYLAIRNELYITANIFNNSPLSSRSIFGIKMGIVAVVLPLIFKRELKGIYLWFKQLKPPSSEK